MPQRVFYPAVAQAIEEYFNSIDINQTIAAKRLGVTPQAVSLQLKQPFGKNVAKKWAKQFGFDEEFLMTGKGSLFAPPDLLPEEEKIYSESIKKQEEIRNERQYTAEFADPNDAEMEKETEFLLNLSIDDLVFNQDWDTTADFNKALQIRDVHEAQIQEVVRDLEYTEGYCKELKEEIKKLRLESMSLRRKIQAIETNKKQ